MNASIAPSDKTADQQQVDLSGAWTTFERCSGNVTGSGQLVLTKTNDGYSVTGKFSNVTVRTGTVSNGAVTIVAANWANRVHYDGKVVDPRRIEGRYSQTVGEWNCTWHATKAD
jgi:hypothetical protein